jgi:hypothetical protein
MSAIRKLGTAILGLALVAGLAACGQDKVTVYEPGKYKGAPVTAPWDTQQYGGKQAQWEQAIQARTQNQNEYARVPPPAAK